MSNGTYDLTWQSSPAERYEVDLSMTAQGALLSAGFDVVGGYGGTDLDTGVCDNAITIRGPIIDSARAAIVVQRAIHHHVQIVPDEDD